MARRGARASCGRWRLFPQKWVASGETAQAAVVFYP